jgi:hypothetical protein
MAFYCYNHHIGFVSLLLALGGNKIQTSTEAALSQGLVQPLFRTMRKPKWQIGPSAFREHLSRFQK